MLKGYARMPEGVVRTAVESDVLMAAGRYRVVRTGYPGKVGGAEAIFPNRFYNNFPNPFNDERAGRELTDRVELSIRWLMLPSRLAA